MLNMEQSVDVDEEIRSCRADAPEKEVKIGNNLESELLLEQLSKKGKQLEADKHDLMSKLARAERTKQSEVSETLHFKNKFRHLKADYEHLKNLNKEKSEEIKDLSVSRKLLKEDKRLLLERNESLMKDLKITNEALFQERETAAVEQKENRVVIKNLQEVTKEMSKERLDLERQLSDALTDLAVGQAKMTELQMNTDLLTSEIIALQTKVNEYYNGVYDNLDVDLAFPSHKETDKLEQKVIKLGKELTEVKSELFKCKEDWTELNIVKIKLEERLNKSMGDPDKTLINNNNSPKLKHGNLTLRSRSYLLKDSVLNTDSSDDHPSMPPPTSGLNLC